MSWRSYCAQSLEIGFSILSERPVYEAVREKLSNTSHRPSRWLVISISSFPIYLSHTAMHFCFIKSIICVIHN